LQDIAQPPPPPPPFFFFFFLIFIVNEWLKMQTEEVVYWIQEFRARVNIYYPSASRLTRLILQSPHGLLCPVLLIIPRVEQGMVFQHLISDYFPLNAGTNLPAFSTIANSEYGLVKRLWDCHIICILQLVLATITMI
jgi:hypothetical protein